VERPTTQNIIGTVETVQSKELGGCKEEHIRHAKLYLSSLIHNETSAPPSSPNSDLLRFNASVSTSNNKIHSAYSCLIAAPHIITWIPPMPILWV
jgi:hypothetical protein